MGFAALLECIHQQLETPLPRSPVLIGGHFICYCADISDHSFIMDHYEVLKILQANFYKCSSDNVSIIAKINTVDTTSKAIHGTSNCVIKRVTLAEGRK